MNYRRPPQIPFNFDELLVDNFAGGGGASTGIEAALGRSVDIGRASARGEGQGTRGKTAEAAA